MKQVRMNDIAKLAGVSQATVSYVLNNNPAMKRVSPDTRERIRQIAADLNYHVNPIAQSMKTQRTGMVGVLLANARGNFINGITYGINRELSTRNYNIFLGFANDDRVEEQRQLGKMLSWRVDGLIVFPVGLQPGETPDWGWVEELCRGTVPTVFIDRYPPVDKVSYVVSDDFGGAVRAVDYLVGLGHRRIAHTTESMVCSSVEDRLEGYRRALAAHGIPWDPALVKRNPHTVDSSEFVRASIRELFELPDPPTAIFSGTRNLETYRALRECGIRIPEDVSMIAFGDRDGENMLDVPLTALQHQHFTMGGQAASLLLELIDGARKSPVQITLDTPLIERGSCRKR